MAKPQTQPVQAVHLEDDGTFPNNALPLLLYDQVLPFDQNGAISAEKAHALVQARQWGHAWTNGILGFHHYHSTAHEVLLICRGQVTVQFGGPQGVTQTVRAGDVVVIPAGVAHKNLRADSGLIVVGAYPQGQDYDMCYGKPGDRPQADRNIASVPLPAQDPIYGPTGPLMDHWHISVSKGK